MSGFNAEQSKQRFSHFGPNCQWPLVYWTMRRQLRNLSRCWQLLENYYLRDNAKMSHRGNAYANRAGDSSYEQPEKEFVLFISAASSKVLLLRGNPTSLNWVSSVWLKGFKPGDEVLISIMEHHSNVIPGRKLAGRLELSWSMSISKTVLWIWRISLAKLQWADQVCLSGSCF